MKTPEEILHDAHWFINDDKGSVIEAMREYAAQENAAIREMYANTSGKLRDLQKELSDTKANLQRAYKGIEHYKEKWQQALELNAELQKQLELLNKEGI